MEMTTIKMDTIPSIQINRQGIDALKQALGVTGTIKFLEQYDHGGSGDYTKEKYLNEDDNTPFTVEYILDMFK